MVRRRSLLCQRSTHLDVSPLFCACTVAHCHVSSALAVQGDCVPTLHGKHMGMIGRPARKEHSNITAYVQTHKYLKVLWCESL